MTEPAPRTLTIKLASRSDRVNWLREHPEVLKMGRKQLVNKLKVLRLLSSSTYVLDVNLYNLMRDAGYPRRVCARFSRAPHMHGITNGKYSGRNE